MSIVDNAILAAKECIRPGHIHEKIFTLKKIRQQKSPQLMAAALLVRPLKLCYNLDNQKYQKSLSKAERLGVFNERL